MRREVPVHIDGARLFDGAVTHYGVTEADVDAVLAATADVLSDLQALSQSR